MRSDHLSKHLKTHLECAAVHGTVAAAAVAQNVGRRRSGNAGGTVGGRRTTSGKQIGDGLNRKRQNDQSAEAERDEKGLIQVNVVDSECRESDDDDDIDVETV